MSEVIMGRAPITEGEDRDTVWAGEWPEFIAGLFCKPSKHWPALIPYYEPMRVVFGFDS